MKLQTDRTGAQAFLQMLLTADRNAALELAARMVAEGGSVADVHLHVVQEAMIEVGRLWACGRISIAAEHTATAIAQYVVTCLYPLIPKAPVSRGQVVVAGVEGEHHQLGAHLVSDALEADGWHVRFLGADQPAEAVADACAATCCEVVALSCTMQENLPRLRSTIARLRIADRTPWVLVGGQGFGNGRSAHALAAAIGADALGLDLRSAVEIVRRWSCAAPCEPARDGASVSDTRVLPEVTGATPACA